MASFGSMTPVMGNANQVLGQPIALNQQGVGSSSFNPALFPRSPLDQVTPVTATHNQMPIQPQMAATPMQQPQPMPPAPQQPSAVPMPQGVVGMPPGNPEAAMIIKALSSRLGSLSKAEEMLHMPQTPLR